AKARGHEIMLHVPMEPESSSENPGPNALLVSAGAEENLKRLRWGLDRLEGIVGINNHMGSRFTATEPALRPVMAELRSRGLLFLDSRTTSSTVAARMAQSMGVPSAARDVFLDHYDSTAHIHDAFDRVEQVAKQQGHAIAIGHPHDRSIEALAEWLPRLAGRGFVLAPVSAVVKKRLDNGHGGNGNTAARTVN
ncbi:MAG: divergent polysaccharide deacetylase family protein, partial [Alphaproteobacteria bacterium]|nr:divergent polysaccharide deacetylase family protein [Alphaproteobacteria bacterium]